VQSFHDQPLEQSRQFQELSPDPHKNSERKIEGYHNPICDTTTISSKKNASASPPNQRSHKEEIVSYPIVAKKKASKTSAKSSYTIADLKAKEKAKNASAKRKKRNYESIAKAKATKGHYNSGRWTRLEHFKFLEALKMFGKEWQKVQQHVFTRTSTQARSHAQKFFVKLDKKQLTLSEFLTRLDIEQLKEDLRLGDAGDSTEYDELQPVIKIANQKLNNTSSVMNIALPNAQGKKAAFKPEEIPEENVANEVAVHNMVAEKEEEQIHCGNKRSSMQRKAKMNHAFLHKNYSDVQATDSFKRRKTEADDEAIIKIRIDNYEVEDEYCASQQASHHDITGVHAHEADMRADSDIQDILEGSAPGEII
jgi:SHAQKYF class myb-like DNA-binding protein